MRTRQVESAHTVKQQDIFSAEDSRISSRAALVLHKRKAARLVVHLVDRHIDVRQRPVLLKNAAQLPHILVPLHTYKPFKGLSYT